MDNQIRPMIDLDVWSIISKEVPADCTMQDDDIRVLLAEAGAWYQMMVTSRKRPLVEDRVFRTEEGKSINDYETELIRMIVDIWITLGGTKGVSDIKYAKYEHKTYGPQLRFIQPLLRHFGVEKKIMLYQIDCGVFMEPSRINKKLPLGILYNR